MPRPAAFAGDEVSLSAGSELARAIEAGGVAVVGCRLGHDHYVLVTGISDDAVEIFDPYYSIDDVPEAVRPRVEGVTFVDDRPFSCNRIVERWVFEEPRGTAYSLNTDCGRDAVMFRRTDGC